MEIYTKKFLVTTSYQNPQMIENVKHKMPNMELPVCKAVYFGESSMRRRNLLPPSSGSNSKPRKNQQKQTPS
jgi:hypothetical protein